MTEKEIEKIPVMTEAQKSLLETWGKRPMANRPILATETLSFEMKEDDSDPRFKVKQISVNFRECDYTIQERAEKGFDAIMGSILLRLSIRVDGGKTFLAEVENHLKNKG